MRPREPPIAARIAISRRRPVARTSSRLATLAQAISSTKLTAPTSTSSDERTLLTSTSRIGSTLKPLFGPSAFGNLRWYSSADSFSRAFACSSVTPGFKPAGRPEVVPLVGRIRIELERESRPAASGRTRRS